VAAASAGPSPDSSAVAVPAGVVIPPDSNWVFTLVLGSRLYPEWKDSIDAKLGQRFYLGDTEFTAEVTEFMPISRSTSGSL